MSLGVQRRDLAMVVFHGVHNLWFGHILVRSVVYLCGPRQSACSRIIGYPSVKSRASLVASHHLR